MDAVGGCGCSLSGPVAAIKRLEKLMLRRDILGGTHETEMAGPADLACNPHTGLSFKIDCASAVFPCDGSHVSPRLNHTLGVSFSLANWAEPKNVDSSPPKSRRPEAC